MKNEDILRHVDHTLLSPTATWGEIEKICKEGVEYQTASVCIPPSFVKRASEGFPSLNICTVIGFPLGYSTAKAKLCEMENAIADGANELDVVVDLGDVKDGSFEKITADLRTMKELCGERILKVIIETCYLTEEEKISLCHCVTDSGADFIKTSTGFGTGGATLEDIELFKRHIGTNVRIKASGGIRSLEDMKAYLEAGCERLGTSGAIKAIQNG